MAIFLQVNRLQMMTQCHKFVELIQAITNLKRQLQKYFIPQKTTEVIRNSLGNRTQLHAMEKTAAAAC
jgi:spore cortex formation protein SpoVR/YcgB (stage V sporulation)